jgi:hypothetical protein
MAKNKYDNCFRTYEGQQGFPLGRILAEVQDSNAKGSNYYFLHWVMPETDLTADGFKVGHPPHIHKGHELLFHIGSDPKNPMDLGAEIEFTIGQEREKHVITKTSVVYIPAGVVHSPWKPVKITRPFLFLQVNQELTHTQKFFPDLVPAELQKYVDWASWEEKGFQ